MPEYPSPARTIAIWIYDICPVYKLKKKDSMKYLRCYTNFSGSCVSLNLQRLQSLYYKENLALLCAYKQILGQKQTKRFKDCFIVHNALKLFIVILFISINLLKPYLIM